MSVPITGDYMPLIKQTARALVRAARASDMDPLLIAVAFRRAAAVLSDHRDHEPQREGAPPVYKQAMRVSLER